MRRNNKFKDFKVQLFDMANNIRFLKNQRRDKTRKIHISELDSEISHLKFNIRHNFIAYCELLGTSYDRIEKPHPNNPPYRSFIEKIKKEWLTRIEDVCSMSN